MKKSSTDTVRATCFTTREFIIYIDFSGIVETPKTGRHENKFAGSCRDTEMSLS